MKQLTTLFMILFATAPLFAQETVDEQYMNAYIVIADTSDNYYELRDKMFSLADKLKLSIDTMERGYSVEKKLVCLPEDHEDEIYAGYYYPRRYPSNNLSLEHLDYYLKGSIEQTKTIAIVATITDKSEEADVKLIEIKNQIEGAYILQAKIYMGCMH